MNRTGIEWTDFTWNPITGCYHDCEYCYARKIAHRFLSEYDRKKCKEFNRKRCSVPTEYGRIWDIDSHIHDGDLRKTAHPFGFEPTLHRYRLNEPLERSKPVKIFVGSMADMFGEWVPDEWIEKVLDVIRQADQHTFQLLTKNPRRYCDFDIPSNCWLGTSVDGTDFKADMERTDIMYYVKANVKFLSIEPLLGNVEDHITLAPFNWVIIGAQTGPGARKPERWWVDQVFRNYNGPVFVKDNLDWQEKIQEFPEVGDAE